MNEEQNKKYSRMNKTLAELHDLESKIARLQFYINENQIPNEKREFLIKQMTAMIEYRVILQDRIKKGIY